MARSSPGTMKQRLSSQQRQIRSADSSTIHDKFMVGYQGWFTCPGDGDVVDPGDQGWSHWFNRPMSAGGRPKTDLWPDVSEYLPSELFPASGLRHKTGEQAFLFSSRHPKTVQRHFNWMALHGIDGAFLHRFVGQCELETESSRVLNLRDEVGERVREAAELEGRVFAIMYDVSGVPPNRIKSILEHDWIHLIREAHVLDSSNYLKERGRPVVGLWGFGFDNSGHTPDLVRAVTAYFRSVTPGGVYIIAGVPTHWRTAGHDADADPEFLDVWLNEFDALLPWTVGRYRTETEVEDYAENIMVDDVELLTKRNDVGKWRKVDYIPVVLPGASGYNMSEGRWRFNDIRRNGGHFLWKQIYNACSQGVNMIYGATWDEYDEGTALMPTVCDKQMLPVSHRYPFMALDEDGYELPSDWYMRICGLGADTLRGVREIREPFPYEWLHEYWTDHPKYEVTESGVDEEVSRAEPSQSSSRVRRDASPPPYSSGSEEDSSGQQRSIPSLLLSVSQPATHQVSPGTRPLPLPPVDPRQHELDSEDRSFGVEKPDDNVPRTSASRDAPFPIHGRHRIDSRQRVADQGTPTGHLSLQALSIYPHSPQLSYFDSLVSTRSPSSNPSPLSTTDTLRGSPVRPLGSLVGEHQEQQVHPKSAHHAIATRPSTSSGIPDYPRRSQPHLSFTPPKSSIGTSRSIEQLLSPVETPLFSSAEDAILVVPQDTRIATDQSHRKTHVHSPSLDIYPLYPTVSTSGSGTTVSSSPSRSPNKRVGVGSLTRFLTISKKDSSKDSDLEVPELPPAELKAIKAEEKKRKKEEVRVRREKLAYDLKMRSKTAREAPLIASDVASSTGSVGDRHSLREPVSLFGGAADVYGGLSM